MQDDSACVRVAAFAPLMREGRLWIRRWYNPKVVGSMLLSTYKMRCLTLISAPKGAQAVWFVENLWTK